MLHCDGGKLWRINVCKDVFMHGSVGKKEIRRKGNGREKKKNTEKNSCIR